MSRSLGSLPVIEWSAKHAVAMPVAGSRVVGETVPEVVKKSGIGKTVLLALSRRSVFVRTTRVPNVSAQEVRQVLGLQAAKLFPTSATGMAVDFKLGTDVNADGRIAGVIAVPSETLRAARIAVSEAGLSTAMVVPAAWGAVMLADSAGMPNCAVVEQGVEGLNIDIVQDGLLVYSRVAPATENSTQISSEVARTFAAAGVAPAAILAAGGLAMNEATQRISMGTLQALVQDGAGQGISLILPEEATKQAASQVGNRSRLAVLMLLATITVGALVFLDRSDVLTKVGKDEAMWQAKMRKLRSTRDEQSKKASDAYIKAGRFKTILSPAQTSSEVLTLVSSRVPQGAWISGISYDRGKPVLIRGTALASEAVTAYLDALNAEPRFKDAKLVFANNATIEESVVVNFSISLRAIGNIPLDEPKKASTSSKAVKP
ncbi:MAG: PilN domain-containing protein [Armatimonadetes bacterium]|nr:PilN domain-containing protein [Armatimonadota bacterium]